MFLLLVLHLRRLWSTPSCCRLRTTPRRPRQRHGRVRARTTPSCSRLGTTPLPPRRRHGWVRQRRHRWWWRRSRRVVRSVRLQGVLPRKHGAASVRPEGPKSPPHRRRATSPLRRITCKYFDHPRFSRYFMCEYCECCEYCVFITSSLLSS